jgi:DNA-3-methyladenine glycosylase
MLSRLDRRPNSGRKSLADQMIFTAPQRHAAVVATTAGRSSGKRRPIAPDASATKTRSACAKAISAALLRTHAMPKARLLRRNFFARSVHAVAPDLIGATLLFRGVGGTIVEVEAYHQIEPAAHSFRGRTERNAVMFGPPGYAYVYRSYGIHWCLNFVCEPEGSASAVLIRALAPTHGLAAMRRRRGVSDERLLCAGPGRLCEALGITRAHDGLALDQPPFELRARPDDADIVAGPRIGLTKAVELPWRYGLNGSRFLSRPFNAG